MKAALSDRNTSSAPPLCSALPLPHRVTSDISQELRPEVADSAHSWRYPDGPTANQRKASTYSNLAHARCCRRAPVAHASKRSNTHPDCVLIKQLPHMTGTCPWRCLFSPLLRVPQAEQQPKRAEDKIGPWPAQRTPGAATPTARPTAGKTHSSMLLPCQHAYGADMACARHWHARPSNQTLTMTASSRFLGLGILLFAGIHGFRRRANTGRVHTHAWNGIYPFGSLGLRVLGLRVQGFECRVPKSAAKPANDADKALA